jgi:hypothetical protein
MPSAQKLDTHHKALTLNLDLSTLGSFAEIGAGQEVARWFLLVGGASGTVAKSISAYDKEVSDDLYGSGSRYVSKGRLEAMLDREWTQLLTQLSKTRGSKLGFSVLSIPSPPVTSPAPTTHMAGSVSGFSCSPTVLPKTSCYTSICAILPMSSSSRPSVFWGSIDYVELRGPGFESWDQRALRRKKDSPGAWTWASIQSRA